MPGRMGGRVFLEELRRKFPGEGIPYLLMTGALPGNPEFKAFKESEGEENILHKPFSLIDLLDGVKKRII